MAVNVQGGGATSKIKINSERPKEKMNLKSRVSKILCADIPFIENAGNGLSNKFCALGEDVITIIGDILWTYSYSEDVWRSINIVECTGTGSHVPVYGGSITSYIQDNGTAFIVTAGGGQTESQISSERSQVVVLDISSNAYDIIDLPSLPYTAAQPLLIFYKKRLHCISGGSTVHYAYDQDSNSWKAMATLPFTHVEKHSIQNGLLYITSGSTNYIYDGCSWKTYNGILPESHGYITTCCGNMHEMSYDNHIVHRTIYYDSIIIDNGCGDDIAEIPSDTESILPLKQSLSATSWADISRISKLGKAREFFDYVSWDPISGPSQIKDGYYIVGFDHDEVADPNTYGRKYAGITFMRDDPYIGSSSYSNSYGEYPMLDAEKSSHSDAAWVNSEIRNHVLPEICMIGQPFKDYIVPVYKKYISDISISTASGGDYASHHGTISSCIDTMFLPSCDEILSSETLAGHSNGYKYCGVEGTPYEYIWIHDWDSSSNYVSVHWTRSRTFNSNFPTGDNIYNSYFAYRINSNDNDYYLVGEPSSYKTSSDEAHYVQPMFCI